MDINDKEYSPAPEENGRYFDPSVFASSVPETNIAPAAEETPVINETPVNETPDINEASGIGEAPVTDEAFVPKETPADVPFSGENGYFPQTGPYPPPVPEGPAPGFPAQEYYPYNAANRGVSSGTEKPREPSGKKKRGSVSPALCLLIVFSCLVSAVLGSVLTLAIQTRGGKTAVKHGTHEDVKVIVNESENGTLMTASQVYAKNVNSTVGITTSVTTNFFGWTTSSAASGSGFIISADGYIITNYHVIESSDSVTVTTYDDVKYPAQIIGFDETNDIAVLKIEAKGLTPVVTGDSDNLNVGDDVVAIGNPLGELTFSLTRGAVSALNREVTVSTGYPMQLIQTDCAINSGNSGGALFNMYGEVIGITNAKYSGSSSSSASIDNIGFAIPINSVFGVVTGIIEKGTVTRNYTGLSVSDISSWYSFYGINAGAVVTAVAADSPAEAAGMKSGDLIMKINGQTVTQADAVYAATYSAKPGDILTFTVYRENASTDIAVEVAQKEVSALTTGSSSSQKGSRESSVFDFFPWF